VGVVLGITLAVALIVTTAGTLLVYPAMWRGFRDQWQRIPPENRRRGRRRGLVGGASGLMLIVFGTALSIIAPWGPNSFVWVVIVGGGAFAILALGAAFLQALRDSRSARRRRYHES
jgi:UDP-N-acetylmuramyl pentapeptide phosphotransferase/UDP-N-acetylglucosamine-1-phosphate transferase